MLIQLGVQRLRQVGWQMAHTVTLSAARVTMVVVQAARKFFCPKIYSSLEFALIFCRVTVSGGTFTATVPARSALAIHSGQKGSGSGSGGGDGTVTVTFAETAQTVFGENIFIAGSLSQLGSWDPNAAVCPIPCIPIVMI